MESRQETQKKMLLTYVNNLPHLSKCYLVVLNVSFDFFVLISLISY